jgi:hypothetical protein
MQRENAGAAGVAGTSVVKTFRTFEGTDTERKRAVFILVFLQTGSESEAMKASGLSSKALERIIHSFADQGDFRERQRPGRPVIYDADVMEAAYQYLVEWEEGYPSGPALMHKLVDEDILEHTVDVDILLDHLKRHVRAMGHILIVDSTKTTFFLTATDVVSRVKFAHLMVEELRSHPADMVIYVDETTLEESPHPKGEVNVWICQRGHGLIVLVWHET